MSQYHSAAQLGAAGSQIPMDDEAHDIVQGGVDQRREVIRKASQATEATSLDLESSTIQSILPPSHDFNSSRIHLQDSSQNVVATEDLDSPCVTTTAQDRIKDLVGALNGNGIGIHEPNQVASSSSAAITPPTYLPRDTTPRATPPSPSTTKTKSLSQSAAVAQNILHSPISNTRSSSHSPLDGARATNIPHEGNMIFSHQVIGAGSTSHRRRQYANTSALTDYEADLTGKDRAKQKEAVKKLLMEKVRDDWRWDWPQPKPEAKLEEEIEPVPAPVQPVDTYESQGSILGEQWKERDEWISNASDSGEDSTAAAAAAKGVMRPLSPTKETAFRFESPDGVGETIKKTQGDRKRRRKKRLAEEMAWNDGVRCFIERRDAWTGARRVSRSSAKLGFTPISQLRKSTSQYSGDEGSSTAVDAEASDVDEEEWEADTEIPIVPPLIPPSNAMRASINPTAYNTIYDKVILQQLTPSCPINLKDVTRSCVQGWKRDGEWPPKSSVPDSLAGKRRRKLSMASLFGLENTKSKEDKEKAEKEKADKEKEKEAERRGSGDHKPGAFKRSIQKLLLLGKDHKDKEIGPHRSIGSNGKAVEAEVATVSPAR